MKTKRILAFVLALVLAFSLMVPAFGAGDIRVTATSDKAQVQKGDTFTITVKVGAADDLFAMQVQLKYDNTKLEYVSSTVGALGSKFTSQKTVTNEDTYIDGSFACNDDALKNASESVLYTVTFKVLTDKAGSIAPTLVADDVFDGSYKAFNVSAVQPVVGIPYVATGVSLDVTSKTLKTGSTQQLKATVQPAEAASSTTLTWSSNNTKVATVSNTGLVTAVAEGKATITVTTNNGKTATCQITVVNCEHKSVSEHPAQAASCTEEGNIRYWECNECHTKWSDEACTTEVTKVTTDKVPHNFSKQDTDAKYLKSEANCHAKAVYYYACSVCGEKATTTFEYGDFDSAKHDGTLSYKHIDGDKHEVYCDGCNAKLREEACKSTKAATCTKKAVCDLCHEEYGELAKHKLTKTEKVDSTCTATGHQAYWTCSRCKGIFADEQGTTATTLDKLTIEKKAHTPGDYVTNATEHFKTCSVCGIEIKDSRAKHTFVKDEATGVETCSVCGYAIGGKVDENHQHAAGNDWFRDENNHWHKCTDRKCTAHVDEAKHDFETVSTTKDGNKTTTVEKCKTCGYVKTTTVDNTPVTPVNPGKPGRPSGTKTVQSGKTFDAGVGVYVGLSILSLTGSAVVIGKKRKDR